MPFTDLTKLSFVMFNKHVNLGGQSGKFLSDNGTQQQLELHSSGMVRVTKAAGEFWVSAACIESCEVDLTPVTAENAEGGAEKADLLKEKAAKSTKTRDLGPKSAKLADSTEHMTRAEQILAELAK